MPRAALLGLTALPLALACPSRAFAQDAPEITSASQTIDFSASQVTYDSDADIIVASGQVRMQRDGNYLAADQITWNRATGAVVADGNVVILNPQGDKLIGDRIDLTDTLRDGTIENLLVVMESGGRIAAARGERKGDQVILDHAIYSACPTVSPGGCPKKPTWTITAARVVQDRSTGRLRFAGGRFNLFGVSLPLLPVFSIGTGQGNEGYSGALLPNFRISRQNGFEIAAPYHWHISSNRDATITPHLYTGAQPALEGRYRQLGSKGAFQVGAFVTYSSIANANPAATSTGEKRDFRGYFEGNGRFQFDPYWRLTGSFRRATDKTITRRYDITRDDRLRSLLELERIDTDSYFSVSGWSFQGLRSDDVQKQIPIALPLVEARMRTTDPWLGGNLEVQANSLAIRRRAGQDTQRAFASATWNLRRLIGFGQELTFTGYARADAYHSNDNELTDVALYRGEEGWKFRGIGALAADMKWPLVGDAFGGTQRLTPRIQLVLTPPTKNLSIPNEDARAIDLEDSNLFSLNRFPGYDRWEDSSRITYGLEWAFDRPNWSIDTVIGQSFRLNRRETIFPDGTGLTDRLSDVVGRTRVRFGRLVDVTHRYRIDKDTFAIRRNELDLAVGSDETYALIGYLRLNRDIDAAIEDLRDKEELRVAGRWKFHRYWSIFGATVFDLTGRDEDPLSSADGWEAVRHRLGVTYEDECLELGVSWKRDYERIGTFRSGSTFSLQFNLKGIGR